MGTVEVDLFSLPAFAHGHRGGMRECADKLMSEAAEAFAEVRNLDWLARNFTGADASDEREAVALELADVLQVVRNTCEACGVTPEDMARAVADCIAKNKVKDGGRYA